MNTIALVGNPNCGKTSIFNGITGTNQHVGNWPGVTVEKKEGILNFNGVKYNIVDLPGTYSLGAYSDDEIVARDFILKEHPDVVINVIDGTNIERNLYLTTQLMEMGVNIVIALNMIDELKGKKIYIDLEKFSNELGVPVIATAASKKIGIDELIKKTIETININEKQKNKIIYGQVLQNEISRLKDLIEKNISGLSYPAEWIAIKLLEKDPYIMDIVYKHGNSNIMHEVEKSIEDITNSLMEPELLIVDKRYSFITEVVKKSVTKPDEYIETTTDKIDKILTHKWLGLPIFAAIMFLVYQLTFKIGQDLLGGIVESAFGILGGKLEIFLQNINAPKMLISFIVDGIMGGVGSVLAFMPLIIIMYMLLGILEDSGYMARAAYVMDRIMRALGLHGKTFISMIVSSGCNVPGIMATRTLDSKQDRMIAILINPFISCGARLPVYLVFISAFFKEKGGLILFVLYTTGILVALIMGKIFSKTLLKGEPSYFLMELPPYRIPTLRNVLLNMWDKVSGFLKRAGTIIFTVVTLLWILSVLPYGVEPYSAQSILGKIGSFIAPIFKPAGFGTWEASVGLFSGIAAKEAVVATLGMVYSGINEGTGIVNAIRESFTPLSAFSFMIMTLLYTPCAATIGTIKKETNSTKWTIFAVLYTFAIGWTAAVLVFQVGKLMGFN